MTAAEAEGEIRKTLGIARTHYGISTLGARGALDFLLAELAQKDEALRNAAETFEDTEQAMMIAAHYTRAALGEQP